MKNLNRLSKLSLCLAVAFSSLTVFAANADVQAQREHWAAYARTSEAALNESIGAMRKLYVDSQNPKVRADLVALLVRAGKDQEALAVCVQCGSKDYSADELENLAKAARNVRDYPQALVFYQQLQEAAPNNKNGLLGTALTAVDMRDYSNAQNAIAAYQKRFGDDNDIQTAVNYKNSQAESLAEKMARLQQKLAANPDDKDTVVQLYRVAARLQAYPVQENLASTYPQYFNKTDQLWLQYTKAVSQLRAAKEMGNKPDIQMAYDRLSQVVNKSNKGSDLYISALRDRMNAAVALEKPSQAIADYRVLTSQGEQPQYVRKLYAEALSAQGSPRHAGRVYQQMADEQQAKQGKVDADLIENIAQTSADLGYYTRAQEELNQLSPDKTKPDFTHTTQVSNPVYKKQYFWNARLEAWNGNMKKAIDMMDRWLADHPADPWAMELRGNLAQWSGKNDEAEQYYKQAKSLLPAKSQAWIDADEAGVLLDNGNWKEVKNMAASIERSDPKNAPFYRAYDEARAAQLSVSGSLFKATSPTDNGNEWAENATLYSKRSAGGHRAYITQQSGYVPNHGDALRYGRVGVGGEFSLYPFTVNAEAGHGTHLNNKAYFNAGVGYRINQAWSVNAKAAINTANTPTKALSQDVYANEYTLSANYTHSANTQVGLGASYMKFDDSNVRTGAYVWLSQALWHMNRWDLNGSLWADYGHNKDVPSAYYYNPKTSKSASGELKLSYALPLDHGMKLTQSLNAGLGRYWQYANPSENTWLVRYNHDWTLGKNWGISYGIGRKRAVYDGKPEFQNYGDVNMNVRFK